MSINWRALSDSTGTPWNDRTGNSIGGLPCINCPFCEGADPSFHLNLFADGGYLCMRDREHRGRQPVKLLKKLFPHRTRSELIALINEFSSSEPEAPSQVRRHTHQEVLRAWDRFTMAGEHPRYLEYLASRGFDDPAALCRRYDLRYSAVGEWAARILFPIKLDGEVVSWTGRTISFHKTRYKMQTVERQDLVYIPRDIRANVVLVEGPIDALKISAATEQMPWSAIALLSASISADRLWRVIDTIANARNVYTSLDPEIGAAYPTSRLTAPVSITNSPYREMNFWLASALKSANVSRLRIPYGQSDWGAMHTQDIVALLSDPYKGNENGKRHRELVTYDEAKRRET